MRPVEYFDPANERKPAANVGHIYQCVNCKRPVLVPDDLQGQIPLLRCGRLGCEDRNACVEVWDRIGAA